MRQALDSGVGLYHASWPVTFGASDVIAGELMAWCRDKLVAMRRPDGVDTVSLAIAAIDGRAGAIASANFSVLKPTAFYTGEIESAVRALLARWATEGRFDEDSVRLSVVLFSWGDLTQELASAG